MKRYFLANCCLLFILAGCKPSIKHEVVIKDVQLEEVKQEETREEPPPPPPPGTRGKRLHTAPADMRFDEWLSHLCTKEHPGKEIIAYHFIVARMQNSFAVVVQGAAGFDEKNPNHIIGDSFSPSLKVFTLNENEFSYADAAASRKKITAMITDFMGTAVYKSSFLFRAKAIVILFDDGSFQQLQ